MSAGAPMPAVRSMDSSSARSDGGERLAVAELPLLGVQVVGPGSAVATCDGGLKPTLLILAVYPLS